MRQGVTIVPFFDSLGKDALSFVINQANLTTMCIEAKNFNNLAQIKKNGQTPTLQTLVIFEGVSDEQQAVASEAGLKLLSYQDLLNTGKEHPEVRLAEPTPETIYMFCYTSGTTGEPKAAMISHLNMVALYYQGDFMRKYGGAGLKEHDICFSYLPMAHIFEQGFFLTSLKQGCAHGIYSGDPLLLFDDIKALQPTFMAAVPRILTRVYAKIQEGIKAKGGAAEWLFNKAVNAKIQNYEASSETTHKLYDALVFKKVRDIFGGNLKQMVCGSAALDPNILKFFRISLGATIIEGYS